ncbi:MAG: TIGR00159 family protein, partial [Bdellovibrionales bacterium]|nr:TIGR00159 family protein [Bdellovibrionales bacterium]
MGGVIANILSGFRLRDLVDILLVAVVVYRGFMILRGTHAIQMITGLLFLGVFYFVSSYFELFTVNWILRYFFDYLFLIVIVLFQDDLRRALAYVGKNPFTSGKGEQLDRIMVEEVAKAAVQMAKDRMGALIV